MRSVIAALRSLVLPFGTTTGTRIVLDGVNGRIDLYNASNQIISRISGSGYTLYNNGIFYAQGANGSYITIAVSTTPFQYFNPSPPASGTAVSAPAVLFASSSSFGTGYVAYSELSSPTLTGGYSSRIRALSSNDDSTLDPYVIVDSNSGAHPVTFWVIGSQRLTGPGDLTMDGTLNALGDVNVTGDETVGGQLDVTGNLNVSGALDVTGTAKIAVPLCVARASSSGQALTSSAWTAINLDAEDFDTNGWHSTSVNNSRITPNIACRLRVWGSVAFSGSATGARRGCCVGLNGSQLNGSAQMTDKGTNATNLAVGSVPYIVDVNGTTDYLQVFGWVEGGAGITTTVASPMTSMLYAEVIEIF